MRCRDRANSSSLSLFFSRLAEQTIRLGFQVSPSYLGLRRLSSATVTQRMENGKGRAGVGCLFARIRGRLRQHHWQETHNWTPLSGEARDALWRSALLRAHPRHGQSPCRPPKCPALLGILFPVCGLLPAEEVQGPPVDPLLVDGLWPPLYDHLADSLYHRHPHRLLAD